MGSLLAPIELRLLPISTQYPEPFTDDDSNTATDPIINTSVNADVYGFRNTIHLHADSVRNTHNIIVLSMWVIGVTIFWSTEEADGDKSEGKDKDKAEDRDKNEDEDESGDEDEQYDLGYGEEDEDSGDDQVDELETIVVCKNPSRDCHPQLCGTHSP
ncbi:hypothetical protein J1N35_044120 [Gossypium stocksii]|uniref:Uncharacterized protein n=1 Tax=Gossypium stocksii TaxID=47602 RepID=A0A9D3U8E0_9ROSI|nr:hypothetical protein J1N35_044120 [Gossypium stocksii]